MHDARIHAEADKVRAEGGPCYFAFHKESENEPELGGGAAFRAAHEHVWQMSHDAIGADPYVNPAMSYAELAAA